jgi:hypothetical protein
MTASEYSNYGPGWTRAIIEKLDGTVFTVGIECDRKKRGTAVNVDVCAHDEAARAAVLQVRTTHFRPNRYSQVRKRYYVITVDASGTALAVPVYARANMSLWSALARALGVTPLRAKKLAQEHSVAELLRAAEFRQQLGGAA